MSASRASWCCLLLLCSAPLAAEPVGDLGEIAVAGSRVPAAGLPETVISADELRQWGAADLADVLALVPGATPARGGDAGPAGLLPGLTGAREADDYLLVVDGVPLGATTAPPFEAVSLTDVERIVIRRGPDPVSFGSAAFAGAIYIYHYPAGSSSHDAHLSVGSYGSRDADLSTALPTTGNLSQSITVQAAGQAYSDLRAGADRYQVFYRAAAPVGPGALRLDAGLLDLQQVPFSPTPVTANGLARDVVLDSNQNPLGARRNEYRSQLALAYQQPLAGGSWSAIASLTHLDNPVRQGFLNDDYRSAGGGDNAEGYSQNLRLNEVCLDSHWERAWGADFSLSFGANDMYGNGAAHSASFGYRAPLTAGAMPAGGVDPDDRSYARDTRNFFGMYAQSHARLAGHLELAVDLRESVTDERRFTGSADTGPDTQTQRNARPSASALLEWHAWDAEDLSLVPYVSYADTFQPSQFDFSPDPDDAAFLQPETVRSWQLGLRGTSPMIEWELSTARVDFGNAVVTQQVGGLPAFVNGGSDAFREVDLDVTVMLGEEWRLKGSYEHVDARYLDYNLVDGSGTNIQLAGRQLPLTSPDRATLGLSYGGRLGFSLAFSAAYQGARFLDPQNRVSAGPFVSYDCTLGYGFGRTAVYLRGENLTDRRDPVAASEVGDGQVYRMQGRQLTVGMSLVL